MHLSGDGVADACLGRTVTPTPLDLKLQETDGLERIDALLSELKDRLGCPFEWFFPEHGPLRRANYPKALQFFAGARANAAGHPTHKERALIAANQVGKTSWAAYEITAHLTGRYPAWWQGWRFTSAQKWWAAGDTALTTRDII